MDGLAPGWGVVVMVVGLLLCFAGGRAVRLGAFCAGLGVGTSLAGALGAGPAARLLTGVLAGVCALLLVALVVGAALVVVGALAGGAVVLTAVQTTNPRGWGTSLIVALVLLGAVVSAVGVLRFRRPLVQVLTALGGAGLVLQGLVMLGPSAISFLRDPGTWFGSVVATVVLLALAVAGWLTQRRRGAPSTA